VVSPGPQTRSYRHCGGILRCLKKLKKKIRRQQLPAGRIFDVNTAESTIRFGVSERGQR
jgi:hypothetical protein